MVKKLSNQIKLKIDNLSKELKKRRKLLGISQANLAKKADLSQSIITKLESKKIDPNISTIFKIEKALENLEIKSNLKAKDIMSEEILSIKDNLKIFEVIDIMTKNDFSQILVYNSKNNLIGCIYEKTLLNLISKKVDIYNTNIKIYIEDLPIIISQNYPVGFLYSIFDNRKIEVVLVGDLGKIIGIISKSDLYKTTR